MKCASDAPEIDRTEEPERGPRRHPQRHLRPYFLSIMSTPAAPAPAISVPLYLAQTSPLSPFSPASGPGADDQAFLFPSLQWNLAQYARQFELASQTEDLAQGGVVVFPEYGLNGIIPDHSVRCAFPPSSS